MRFDHSKSLLLSGGLFLALFAGGFILSQHKVLWGDEFFTQKVSIDGPSYMDILTLHFIEGNKCPLFYLVQKSFSDLFSYKFPVEQIEGLNVILDRRSQIIMRMPSNVYMSLALALIFYFFTRFFSVFAAIYALSVALVSPLVWMYWVEARPYSLWFLLTTIQLLLISCNIISPKIKTTKSLFLTHVLLALTVPASILQISIALLVLWWKGKYSKKQLALVWVVPVCIGLFYYFIVHAYRTKTFLFFSNLYDAVMPERLFVYVIYALVAWVLPEKYKKSSRNTFFLPVFLLFLASAVFILSMDLFTKNFQFGFFSRYLIFLTPADILMFTFASIDLRRWSRPNPWICMNVSILLGGLVLMRGLVTYRAILASALYLHSP